MTRKTNFFKGCSWFNNLGPTLGMTLKFYTSVGKWLKLKVKILEANSFPCRNYRGKTDREGLFAPPPPLPPSPHPSSPSWIGLKSSLIKESAFTNYFEGLVFCIWLGWFMCLNLFRKLIVTTKAVSSLMILPLTPKKV